MDPAPYELNNDKDPDPGSKNNKDPNPGSINEQNPDPGNQSQGSDLSRGFY